MTTWLLGLSIKATLLLVSVGLVAAVARRSPAATRHFVWVSGLAALLALPLLVALTPGWSPPWAEEWLPAALLSAAPVKGETAASQASVAFAGRSLQGGPDEVDALLAELDFDSVTATSRVEYGIGRGVPVNPEPTPLPAWLVLAWVGGTLVVLGRLAVGFGRRTRLARAAREIDTGPMVRTNEAAAEQLGLRRRVRLLLSDAPAVPMTWGVSRPVLFLPAAAKSWSERRLRVVLLHELAHIKRRDSLSRTLAQLACGVFWFHPLAWLSARRMLREQERACDDVVILAGADPHHYAETLVSIAREFRAPRPIVVGALAFARRSNLEQRLVSILDPLERRKKLSPFHKAVVLVLFVGLALPLAALHPTAAAQEAAAGPQIEQSAKSPPQANVEPSTKAAPAPEQQGVSSRPQKSRPRAKSSVAPPADVAGVRVGVTAPRAGVATAGVGVVAPRASVATAGVTVAAPRAGAAATGIGVAAPEASVATAGVSVAPSPAAPSPQERVVWTQRATNRIQLRAEGAIRIADDVSGLELEEGGRLILSEGDRRLEVRPLAGGLDFTYTVDGAETDFDDEARRWANEILAHVAEMGDLRGNIFISTSRSEVGGELSSVLIAPGELTIEKLDLAEPLKVTVEALETLPESVVVNVEPVEIRESVAIALEQELVDEHLKLAIEELELADEQMKVSVKVLDELSEAVVVNVEPLELVDESVAIALEPLELAVELSLLESIRERRFDRVINWSEDGSRFVAMWRGPVSFGASIDDIDVGEGGHLVIDERGEDGVHRRLHVSTDEAGETAFEWFIDGEPDAFDEEARAWLRPVLAWLNENAG